jgi:flagellar L-ring protein FlgH
VSNQQFMKLAMGIAIVVVLSACASTPKAPSFDATWPEPPAAAPVASGSIYQVGHDVALFENSVARRVGDTVTVNLVESTAAQKSSSTKTSKATKVDLPGPTLLGVPVTLNGKEILSADIANNRNFDGAGDSQLSNKLQGSITVTVAQRLSNGNLMIRGQKWIGINQGREFIDILPDNSIPSYKVADANISYGGQGALADANRPGLLSRFFNSRWNPL